MSSEGEDREVDSAAAMEELVNLRESMKQLQSEKENLEDTLLIASQEMQRMKEATDEATSKLSQLDEPEEREQLASVKAKLDETQRELADYLALGLEGLLQEANQEGEEARESLKSTQVELKVLQVELSAAREREAQHQARANQLEGDIEKLKQATEGDEVEQNAALLTSLREQLEAEKAARLMLEREKEREKERGEGHHEGRATALEEQLHEARVQARAQLGELKEMQEKIEAMKNELRAEAWARNEAERLFEESKEESAKSISHIGQLTEELKQEKEAKQEAMEQCLLLKQQEGELLRKAENAQELDGGLAARALELERELDASRRELGREREAHSRLRSRALAFIGPEKSKTDEEGSGLGFGRLGAGFGHILRRLGSGILPQHVEEVTLDGKSQGQAAVGAPQAEPNSQSQGQWVKIGQLGDAPPDASLDSPATNLILETWSDELEKRRYLLLWLKCVVDGKRSPELPLTLHLTRLEPEVKEGLLVMVLPILVARDASFEVYYRLWNEKWEVRLKIGPALVPPHPPMPLSSELSVSTNALSSSAPAGRSAGSGGPNSPVHGIDAMKQPTKPAYLSSPPAQAERHHAPHNSAEPALPEAVLGQASITQQQSQPQSHPEGMMFAKRKKKTTSNAGTRNGNSLIVTEEVIQQQEQRAMDIRSKPANPFAL